MVDCALGSDNLRIAIFLCIANTSVSYRVDEQIIGFVSHALSMCFAIEPQRTYCTLQYRYEMLDGNLQTRQLLSMQED